ncbi:MAG: hypothetical protein GXO48_07270, partial [Chlorobi bacterium]|nr:hypothetical protein [Chlorobiota bacterium]
MGNHNKENKDTQGSNETVYASLEIKKILQQIFPSQLPKNVLRDLILSMDRGERRFVALKLRRYNKRDKESSAIVRLYEILSRHATPNKDEIDILRRHAANMPHLEQVRQRLIKIILFALVEYRYLKQQKNIYINIAEILELLKKGQTGAAKALFTRLANDFEETTNPFNKVLLIDVFMKILLEGGPMLEKKEVFDPLFVFFSYQLLEKALDDIYKYRKVVRGVNDLTRAIVTDAFPVAKSMVDSLAQCMEEVAADFFNAAFAVEEFQILYARLLELSILFRRFDVAEKLVSLVAKEFDLKDISKYVENGTLHVELAISLIDWYSHHGNIRESLSIATKIISHLKNKSFSSDLKPLYLLRAYSKTIPAAWYSGNLERAIELVEEGEDLLAEYNDVKPFNKLALFKMSKILFRIQSAISYVAIGNLRFAKRIVDNKGFQREIKVNRGIYLTALLATFIVFAESDETHALKQIIDSIRDLGSQLIDQDLVNELADILEVIYVQGDKTFLKDKFKKAFELTSSLLIV